MPRPIKRQSNIVNKERPVDVIGTFTPFRGLIWANFGRLESCERTATQGRRKKKSRIDRISSNFDRSFPPQLLLDDREISFHGKNKSGIGAKLALCHAIERPGKEAKIGRKSAQSRSRSLRKSSIFVLVSHHSFTNALHFNFPTKKYWGKTRLAPVVFP